MRRMMTTPGCTRHPIPVNRHAILTSGAVRPFLRTWTAALFARGSTAQELSPPANRGRFTVPYQTVGKHRRVRKDDVMAYKTAIDREREAVLDQLAAEAQEQDMAYGD